jgi:hypothetical protein
VRVRVFSFTSCWSSSHPDAAQHSTGSQPDRVQVGCPLPHSIGLTGNAGDDKFRKAWFT